MVSLKSVRILAAQYSLGLVSAPEIQQVVDAALTQGIWAEAFGPLITEPSLVLPEAGRLLESALKELGIPSPSYRVALDSLLKNYMRDIAEGAIPPYEGIRLLKAELYYPIINKERVTRRIGDFQSIQHLLYEYYNYDDLPHRPNEVSADGESGAAALAALDNIVVEHAVTWNREHDTTSIAPAWLSWNDGIVTKLAQAIHADRGFDRLPILGDALEEAGCCDPDILEHCRSEDKHIHGCWVVDLLLRKQ